MRKLVMFFSTRLRSLSDRVDVMGGERPAMSPVLPPTRNFSTRRPARKKAGKNTTRSVMRMRHEGWRALALPGEVDARRAACGTAEIAPDGIVGDRLVHVENERGVVTARTHPRLLGFAATFDDEGDTLVDGVTWRDPHVGERVREEVGPEIRLVESDGGSGSTSCRSSSRPTVRSQPSGATVADYARMFVVAGVEGLAEREWEGHRHDDRAGRRSTCTRCADDA